MTLLSRALEIKQRRGNHFATIASQEEQNLALAWVSGIVGLKQATLALGYVADGAATYSFLANALRTAVTSGRLRGSHAVQQ